MQFDDDSGTSSSEVPSRPTKHGRRAAPGKGGRGRGPRPASAARPEVHGGDVMAELKARLNALPTLVLVPTSADDGSEDAPLPRIADEESLRVCAAELGGLVEEHAVLTKLCDEGDEIACGRITLVAICIAVFVGICSRYFDAGSSIQGGLARSPIEAQAIDTMMQVPFDDPDVLDALAILVLGEERDS